MAACWDKYVIEADKGLGLLLHLAFLLHPATQLPYWLRLPHYPPVRKKRIRLCAPTSGLWLCVPAFQRVCPYRLTKVYIKSGLFSSCRRLKCYLFLSAPAAAGGFNCVLKTAQVLGPTFPSASRLLALWKSSIAFLVILPDLPSTSPM